MKLTEKTSNYNDLEKQSIGQLLQWMNEEDQTVPKAVEKCIPQIEALVHSIIGKMKKGGRLFYIGAGTSGRLGILDASECPPTFGVPHDWVIGLIAGGDSAIRKAVERAEDDRHQAFIDLENFDINHLDTVIGIAASGSTPYVVSGLEACQQNGITTGCITCTTESELAKFSDFPIEVLVGPEFVTGSTRLKSGTAQKLVLNMISTSVMIGLGRVEGNKMVDMQLSNDKLKERGTRLIMHLTDLPKEEAREQLLKMGSVRRVVENWRTENQ